MFFLKIHFRYKYRDIRFIYEFKVRFGNATELVLRVISIFGPLHRCFATLTKCPTAKVYRVFSLISNWPAISCLLLRCAFFSFVFNSVCFVTFVVSKLSKVCACAHLHFYFCTGTHCTPV